MSKPDLTREQLSVLDDAARLAVDGLLYMPSGVGGHSRAQSLVRRGLLSDAGKACEDDTHRTGQAYRLTRAGMAALGKVAS